MNVKTKVRAAIAGLMLAVMPLVATGAPSSNKTNTPTIFQLNVPFEFVAGNRTLPPGTYSFERILNTADGFDVLVIRCQENCRQLWIYQSIATTTVKADEPQSRSKLVFKRYGQRHFLSQVWTPEKLTGLQVRNREEQDLGAQGAADEEVVLPGSASPTKVVADAAAND